MVLTWKKIVMSAFRVPAVITTICCMMVSTYASSVYGVCRCMRFYQCNRDKGRVAALDVALDVMQLLSQVCV